MKRKDAVARLDDAVWHLACLRDDCGASETDSAWRAYRRALRTLLKERAEALAAVCEHCGKARFAAVDALRKARGTT